MSNQYIDILEESLRKKSQVLDMIIIKNDEQKKILEAETFDMEAFDKNTDEKGELIERLLLLDSGFEKVYDRVRDELLTNRDQYATQIETLQSLIRDITEKSVSIQATEQRNKNMVEAKFRKEREKIQFGKNSMKVAKQYYNNMNKLTGAGPFFLDNKK